MTSRIDELDGRILDLFSTEPRVGVLEASRRLRVARGTVQARLDRLERDGVVTSWAPRISPAALGYAVTAFVTLEILQHEGCTDITRRLARSEVWRLRDGSGDLWCGCVPLESGPCSGLVHGHHDTSVSDGHLIGDRAHRPARAPVRQSKRRSQGVHAAADPVLPMAAAQPA